MAAVVFGALVAVAFPVLLLGPGADYWFAADELRILSLNPAGSLSDLFEPENLHWSTVPIAAYWLLYKVFGLHSYVPYQACVIGLHLTLAVQIRMVMRRASVAPWIATVAAASFVLFGPGEQNILNAIQISMVGSMVFGFAHLMLADHDGPIGRRDAAGLACGALGLMSSGIGPALVAVVGLAALIRRGWRAAALHTVPLGLLYGIWWWTEQSVMDEQKGPLPTPEVVARWVATGERAVFDALGQYPLVAVAMAAMLVVGLVLAWRPLSFAAFRRAAAAPLALLVGAALVLAATSLQRWNLGNDFVKSSRYLSMATALTLPALAVAGDAVARRWRILLPVVLAVFLVPIPANFRAFDGGPPPEYYERIRRVLLASAYSPDAELVPRDLQPLPLAGVALGVTMGFLVDARESGRLPDPPAITTDLAGEIEVRLGIRRVDEALPDDAPCLPLTGPVVVEPELGDRLVIQGAVDISSARHDGAPPVTFQDPYGGFMVLAVELPDLQLRFAPTPPAVASTLCR